MCFSAFSYWLYLWAVPFVTNIVLTYQLADSLYLHLCVGPSLYVHQNEFHCKIYIVVSFTFFLLIVASNEPLNILYFFTTKTPSRRDFMVSESGKSERSKISHLGTSKASSPISGYLWMYLITTYKSPKDRSHTNTVPPYSWIVNIKNYKQFMIRSRSSPEGFRRKSLQLCIVQWAILMHDPYKVICYLQKAPSWLVYKL